MIEYDEDGNKKRKNSKKTTMAKESHANDMVYYYVLFDGGNLYNFEQPCNINLCTFKRVNREAFNLFLDYLKTKTSERYNYVNSKVEIL